MHPCPARTGQLVPSANRLLAQFPNCAEQAVVAAVWLHGRAGEIGAAELGEKAFMATDILRYLPEAMRECAKI